MAHKGEYQGGYYAFVEYIGLYIRYFIFIIFGIRKSLIHLSGEENYPKIRGLQRFYCLIVGLFVSIMFLIGFIASMFYVSVK